MSSAPAKKEWKRRCVELHARYLDVAAENQKLRAALDELNNDVEDFLNVAHQAGHEAAKSWMIRAQAETIRNLRKENKRDGNERLAR